MLEDWVTYDLGGIQVSGPTDSSCNNSTSCLIPTLTWYPDWGDGEYTEWLYGANDTYGTDDETEITLEVYTVVTDE